LETPRLRRGGARGGKRAAGGRPRGPTAPGVGLSPPKFGRGPNNEVWELFDHLPALLADVARLLAPAHAFMILTAYAIRASALSIDRLTKATLAQRGGVVESGELAIRERDSDRLLSAAL